MGSRKQAASGKQGFHFLKDLSYNGDLGLLNAPQFG